MARHRSKGLPAAAARLGWLRLLAAWGAVPLTGGASDELLPAASAGDRLWSLGRGGRRDTGVLAVPLIGEARELLSAASTGGELRGGSSVVPATVWRAELLKVVVRLEGSGTVAADVGA